MRVGSALRLSAPPLLRSAPRCAASAWQDAIYRDLYDERAWGAVESAIRAAVCTGTPLPGDARAAAALSTRPPLDPAEIEAQLAREAREWQGKRPPRQTWCLHLAYFGPAFSSFTWQRDSPERTVWGSVEEALRPLIGGENALVLACAGRTDAGVSAVGQSITFYSWKPLDAAEIMRSLNAARPGALRLRSAHRVPRSFHATFGAKWRRYVYLLPTTEREAAADLAAEIDTLLDPLVGKVLDYSALGRGVPKGKSTSCVLHAASARPVLIPARDSAPPQEAIRFEVLGDRFLRRQVNPCRPPLTAYYLHLPHTTSTQPLSPPLTPSHPHPPPPTPTHPHPPTPTHTHPHPPTPTHPHPPPPTSYHTLPPTTPPTPTHISPYCRPTPVAPHNPPLPPLNRPTPEPPASPGAYARRHRTARVAWRRG